MGKNVFANGMEVVAQGDDAKVIAAFPDVCMSPPPPPAGPVPVPYPNTSSSSDLKDGSKAVLIGGKPAGLNDSYYQTSPLGNEAATRNFGGSVVTHGITGKTYFKDFSMNVVFEGKAVVRHLDITGCNATSDPAVPIGPNTSSAASAASASVDSAETECPCCHKKPAHPNQLGKDNKMLRPMSEQEYYASNVGYFTERSKAAQQLVNSGTLPKWWSQVGKDENPLFDGMQTGPMILAKAAHWQGQLGKLQALRTANPDCPNLHKEGEPCGIHFGPQEVPGAVEQARKEWYKARRDILRDYAKANPGSGVNGGSQGNHMTPLDAGGCPTSRKNVIPDPVLSGPCKEIENLQTNIQGILSNRKGLT